MVRKWVAGLTALIMGVGLTACGTTPNTSLPAHQTVQVAYAGSLAYLMDQVWGPKFQKATHIRYEGRGGGSFGLAREIKANAIPAQVFISIGTAPIAVLKPKATWAVSFATAPLVVAFNPQGPFGAQLRAIQQGRQPLQDLFTLMAEPGFHLGRTNPATDPQGRAFYLMVKLAQKQYRLPSGTAQKILGGPGNSREVFSETGILSQIQAGSLDASSAFLPEALEHHLAYITLPPSLNFGDPQDQATYASATMKLSSGVVHGSLLTVAGTALNGSGRAVGIKFLSYLLSPSASRQWTHYGYHWIPFEYWGQSQAVPSTIRHESP